MRLGLTLAIFFAPLTLNAWTFARVEIERTALEQQISRRFPETLPSSLRYHDAEVLLIPNTDRIFLKIPFTFRAGAGEVYASSNLAFDNVHGAFYFDRFAVDDVQTNEPPTLFTQQIKKRIQSALPAWLNHRFAFRLEAVARASLQHESLQDVTVQGGRVVLRLGIGEISEFPTKVSDVARLKTTEPGLTIWILPNFAKF